jgi:FtsH-binding integral membrane protein
MVQDYDTGGTFRPLGARTDTGTLFGRTMGLVAVTVGLFALGAYLARNLSGGWAMAFWIASFVCLLAMNVTVRRSEQLTLGLLFGFGLLVGLATAPTISYYANVDPEAVWGAGGATALFVAGFGAAGYATRRDLSVLARVLWWALIALIGFGMLLIFFSIPAGSVIYALLGLVIFTAATAGLLASSLGAERFAKRRPHRTLILAGFLVTIAGIGLLLAMVIGNPSVWAFTPGLLLIGLGLGLMLTPSVNVVQSAFPEERQGEISGLSRSISNLGSCLGTAIAGTILVAGITATPERSYGLAMVVLAAVGLVGLAASLLLPRTPAPADASVSRP